MTPEDHPEGGRTRRLSQEALETLRETEQGRSSRPELALVIYYRDGVRVAPLAERAPVVVGRVHPSDVAIRDVSLSRQHASFEVRQGRVWVEDLDSTNGTWVDKLRIERVEVKEGVELYLGAVMATVQRLSSLDAGGLELVSHDGFCAELGAEIERARVNGRSLCLMMVHVGSREPAHLSRWLPEVRGALRPFDRVALYSPQVAEVILPELTAARARELAAAISGDEAHLRCGLAGLGDGLRTTDALLEAARAALRATSSERPVIVHQGAGEAAEAMPVGRALGKDVIAESPAIKKLLAVVERLASSSIPVLIQGETGAGKEVVSRALHDGGKRAGRPLIAVNCGAIPAQLIESTLFGHEKGAFTGATAQRQGVFEAAQGGTVLLDEIGELPPAAQATLLRVLETKRITRVGATKEVEVDVRVLAATHRDLEAMVDEGTFRADLLFRLDAMALRIPPLRERREDIEPMARRFLALAAEANDREVQDISDAAMDRLLGHGWPGNVRELRNTIERATVIAQGSVITVEDLPERMRTLESPSGLMAPLDLDLETDGEDPGEGKLEMINLKAEVRAYEAAVIRKVLRRTAWKRKEAAQLLGIPLRTLADKITAFDLKPE